MSNMRWHDIRNSLPARVALVIFASLIGYGAYTMVERAVLFDRESRELEETRLELVRKSAEYETYLAELETPEAVEREAKARFNLKRPGEEVVVVVPEKQEEAEAERPSTLWEYLARFFSDVFRFR